MSQSLMPNMTLSNIEKACQGTYFGKEEDREKVIAGAVIDSRQVEEGYLFIAVPGERVDGHDFIPQVFEKGALCVLSEKKLDQPAGPYILVESSTEAMKKLARFYRQQLTCKVVGITGSVGKTSTKEMIATVLSEKYNVLKTAGNFNNEIGLPLTIFRIRPEHQVAVLEMGISDFGEMNRLGAMGQPDISVITNIGTCHLENLGDRDGVLRAKTEMFDHLQEGGIAILNGDDDKLCTKPEVNGAPAQFFGIVEKEELSHACTSQMCGMFQLSEKTSAVLSAYATDVENLGFEGMRAVIHYPGDSFTAEISIPGAHNVYNALAATLVGRRLGLSKEEIARGIKKAKTIQGRTNFIHTETMTVIDDCYNANPMSMAASLDILSYSKGRAIAVLGDMGELGTDEVALHHQVGLCVGEKKIPVLFCAGELAKEYAAGAAEKNPDCQIVYSQTREELTEKLLAFVEPGDTILVKASHFMEFPKIVEALTQAGH